MFQTKVVEKIKTHILCSVTVFRKLYRLLENAEKYCRARQATDDSIIRRMRIACWITKATNTHSEYVILSRFTTAKMVARAHRNVTLYVHCIVLYSYLFQSKHTDANAPLHFPLSSFFWQIKAFPSLCCDHYVPFILLPWPLPPKTLRSAIMALFTPFLSLCQLLAL